MRLEVVEFNPPTLSELDQMTKTTTTLVNVAGPQRVQIPTAILYQVNNLQVFHLGHVFSITSEG